MDWKKTLATVAPALATALGGPMAGVAVSMAGKALGLGEGVTENDLAAVVASGNPDALLKLKQADNEFKVEMEKLGVKIHEIDAVDRASARELAKTDMKPQIILSVIFIGGYFGAMVALHGVLFDANDINPQIIALFSALIGVFTREMSGIMQFWFGSSSGSKTKSDQMAQAK